MELRSALRPGGGSESLAASSLSEDSIEGESRGGEDSSTRLLLSDRLEAS
jgi:hypothetical protein